MLDIYIVSLKRDIEKRKIISKILDDFGLQFEFIDAIYGKELSDNYLNSVRGKSTGKILDRGYGATPGEIGCTLSHIKIYQKILDNKIDWACILEDDAILDERFKEFINTFQDTTLDPEVLYILGGQNGLDQTQVIKSIKNYNLIGGQKFHKTIKSEHAIYRTCCYLVSSHLANQLIELSRSNFILADDWDYLLKSNLIKQIYLSDFVDHPLDLSVSYLEKERQLAALEKVINNPQVKISFSMRVKNSLRWRLRLFFLKLYRYIEKKDTL